MNLGKELMPLKQSIFKAIYKYSYKNILRQFCACPFSVPSQYFDNEKQTFKCNTKYAQMFT